MLLSCELLLEINNNSERSAAFSDESVTIYFFQGALLMIDQNTEKYGDVWGYYEGSRPTVVISNVEMMKEIYIKQFSKFYSRKVK